jgi:hypothetical protein
MKDDNRCRQTVLGKRRIALRAFWGFVRNFSRLINLEYNSLKREIQASVDAETFILKR